MKLTRAERRQRRHRRVRLKVFGTPERPRLSVHKSLKHLRVQVIDDTTGRTLVAASTLEPELGLKKSTVQTAQTLGRVIAERALQKGIKRVVFDRGGYRYHGVVKALAEASRQAGLEF
ncbi:MAG: 50S ribosomal protein L18 [Candidatus Bipolaricaulota bacterium]|nr:50S ribosomal protein L18 [Candidatus Bipolaricaulota bacterium]MCS7275058.1 50S ribosomal protein L18 [Candidatus Bipolaricaulota bacterium]MDW8110386.1 50S ribosomal protein L18 [Candidatus Bipolaricaulota bacterium]MDW8329543.1 50S ribosomal protein L18 [Candidatus Bipolaricaulota bacterium]